MTPAPLALKFTARQLYKELLHLGRDYPDPKYPIAKKLHGCFSAFIGGDEARVREGIVKAEYIKKGASQPRPTGLTA